MRGRAPGKAGARAARHDGHGEPAAGEQYRLDLGLRARQHHHPRHLFEGGERVAFVRAAFLGAREHAIRGQYRAQRGDDVIFSHAPS